MPFPRRAAFGTGNWKPVFPSGGTGCRRWEAAPRGQGAVSGQVGPLGVALYTKNTRGKSGTDHGCSPMRCNCGISPPPPRLSTCLGGFTAREVGVTLAGNAS